MEYKAYPNTIKQIEGRSVTGLASITGNLDAGGDIVEAGAFIKTIQERAQRIKHLWQHDTYSPPIATIQELREVGTEELPSDLRAKYPTATGGLLVKREYLDTPRGNEILAGLQSSPPAITEMSFAFDPITVDFSTPEDGPYSGKNVRHLIELRLWETSDVVWGMNEATVASKHLIPYQDTGVNKSHRWATPQLKDYTQLSWDELEDTDKEYISSQYAYSKNTPAQSFNDLLFPHHIPGSKGLRAVSYQGLKQAWNDFINTTLPLTPAEREGIYKHLAKHLTDFGEEPPVELELITVAHSLQEALKLASIPSDLSKKIQSTLNGIVGPGPLPLPTNRELRAKELELLSLELEL